MTSDNKQVRCYFVNCASHKSKIRLAAKQRFVLSRGDCMQNFDLAMVILVLRRKRRFMVFQY